MVKTVKRPLIVAHRGGSPGDVDNSMAAFKHALTIGADLIECDLRRSAEGMIVLYHDAAVGGRKLRDMTVAEMRAVIPTLITLDELLDRVASFETSGKLVLDLKERGIEQLLIPVLDRRPDLVSNVLVSTVHTMSLRRLSQRFPTMRLALSRGHLISSLRPIGLHNVAATLLRPVFPLWLSLQVRWCGAMAVAMQHGLIDATAVRRYHRLGCRAYTWTVDDCATAQHLAAAGVDMIATNVPGELQRCLER